MPQFEQRSVSLAKGPAAQQRGWRRRGVGRAGGGAPRDEHLARGARLLRGQRGERRRDGRRQGVYDVDLPKLKALIDVGGDLSEPDTKGQTPLHVAALAALSIEAVDDADEREYVRVRTDVLKLLAGTAKASNACDVTNNEGMSALHLFVRNGHVAGATVLLEAGADPNVRSRASGEYRSGQWARQVGRAWRDVRQPVP